MGLELKDSLLEDDEIDLRSFKPAGGPILLQALELPPQAKTIRNWTIKKGIIWGEVGGGEGGGEVGREREGGREEGR